MTVQLFLYLGFARIAGPLWRVVLRRRLARGKEDAARMGEKLAQGMATRPKGPLIWLHAVSVGEALSLMTLLDRLGKSHPQVHFLLTTASKTSADMLAERGLPPRVIHQYQPVDTIAVSRRFLAHWQPDVAVFSELDMWPALLRETSRASVPMALINARMSDRSLEKRRKAWGLYRAVVRMFDAIQTQDDTSWRNFVTLGADPARVETVGPIKLASDPLPDVPEASAALRAALGDRPVWLAASTEPREEERILEAHEIALRSVPDLLLIIAPRHPHKADATQAHAARFNVARRSRGELPAPDTSVYLADTLGEMGVLFRAAPICFMGHSLPVDGEVLPGKNPLEPIALDTVVIHGPDYGEFELIYDGLCAAMATVTAQTPDEIAKAVVAGQDPKWRAPMIHAGQGQLAKNQTVLTAPLDLITGFLNSGQ